MVTTGASVRTGTAVVLFVESSWRLEVIDDAGHWVQVDQSATVSDSICRFLAD